MLLSALRRRSVPAWVGIFAMLTIFIAPVISQTLVLHEHGAMSHGAASTGSHSNDTAEQPPNHAGHMMSEHQAAQSHHSPASPSMMMDHAACGYCVLFSYTPALFATGSINPQFTASLSKALVIRFISRIVLPERYASPVVRAPPL